MAFLRRGFSTAQILMRGKDLDWAEHSQDLVISNLKTALRSSRKCLKIERKRYLLLKEISDLRIGTLQRDYLCLKNEHNLIGALEFSLNKYADLKLEDNPGKDKILSHIVRDSSYRTCLKNTLSKYDSDINKNDVTACSLALRPTLAKHAGEGNELELVVDESEHTIVELAAIETVFSTLKKYGCFLMRLKLFLQNGEKRKI